MGLLPEVYKRKLYERKGFSSVFEFAKKLAGLSEEQVRRVLNLEKKFEETPILKNLLLNGEVSVNKLARVASIATKENEEALAEQVKLLPQTALETLVKDERKISENNMIAKNRNGLQMGFFEEKSVRAHNNASANERSEPERGEQPGVKQNVELELSAEVMEKLLELQQKGIDINELILETLKKRELEIAQEKEQMAEEMDKRVDNPSRYIPIKTKNLLQKEHGSKCSLKTCQKPAKTIHHTQRFALSQSHDPRYLAPLCKNHHLIAHSIDQKFQQKRAFAMQ